MKNGLKQHFLEDQSLKNVENTHLSTFSTEFSTVLMTVI